MPAPLSVLKANIPYAYAVMGVVWLALAFTVGSTLLIWPVAALVLGGALLKLMPGQRLSWAWATAAGVMGLLLALYQAYVAAPLVSGSFSTIAGSSLVLFVVFAAIHLLLVFVLNTKTED